MDTIETIPLGRNIYSRLLKTSSEVTEAEKKLVRTPSDVLLRSTLLATYSVQASFKDCSSFPLEQRIRHIFWFVENLPDWRFCGEIFFYLKSSDAGYIELKDLWLKQIKHADTLMRRINTYQFLVNADDPDIDDCFKQFFEGYGESIWVRAISQLFAESPTWLMESNMFIGSHVDGEYPQMAMKLQEIPIDIDSMLADLSRRLDTITIEQYNSAKSRFEVSPNFQDICTLAAFTWTRLNLHSYIGFDPEILALRFQLAKWIIRNFPNESFSQHPFFIAPFNTPEQVTKSFYKTSITQATERLVELWIEQLDLAPTDSQAKKNAHSFFHSLSDRSSSIAGILKSKLLH
jgi:hypothetical protein